jgi:hypothetical protein
MYSTKTIIIKSPAGLSYPSLVNQVWSPSLITKFGNQVRSPSLIAKFDRKIWSPSLIDKFDRQEHTLKINEVWRGNFYLKKLLFAAVQRYEKKKMFVILTLADAKILYVY